MINIEYKDENGSFPRFYNSIKDKGVLIICDVNTRQFADRYERSIRAAAARTGLLLFEDKSLMPDKRACGEVRERAKDFDYILAVGSGTLNDLAKYISTESGKGCGVLATAPSMDGYASKNAAYISDGQKLAAATNAPHDILIDLDIICDAPANMIAAGVGDILGKFTSLADWELSGFLNGEDVNKKAFDMMRTALKQCLENFDGIVSGSKPAVASLMNALIISGLAMAENGNSRPASGSEHHMSHFLEMEFIKRGNELALHGIQVGIGTLASLVMYKSLCKYSPDLAQRKEVCDLIKQLPEVDYIRSLLKKVQAPVRFSEIGVEESTARKMLVDAYKVRERFTILTLINRLGLSQKIIPEILAECY